MTKHVKRKQIVKPDVSYSSLENGRIVRSISFNRAMRWIKGAPKEQHQDIICAVCFCRDTDGTIYHTVSPNGTPTFIPLCHLHDHKIRLPRARILYHHMTSH